MRLRIPARKGDEGFFASLGEALARNSDFGEVQINHHTGSVLLKGKDLDVGRVHCLAADQGLFRLEALEGVVRSELRREFAWLFRRLNALLVRSSHGEMDFPMLAFFSFLTLGTVHIVREGLTTPPWHAAFWYAAMLAPGVLGPLVREAALNAAGQEIGREAREACGQ
jgi:hypothetical protein